MSANSDRFWVTYPGSNVPATGPFSASELLDQHQSGRLGPNAVVCKVGESSWQPLADVLPHESPPAAMEDDDQIKTTFFQAAEQGSSAPRPAGGQPARGLHGTMVMGAAQPPPGHAGAPPQGLAPPPQGAPWQSPGGAPGLPSGAGPSGGNMAAGSPALVSAPTMPAGVGPSAAPASAFDAAPAGAASFAPPPGGRPPSASFAPTLPALSKKKTSPAVAVAMGVGIGVVLLGLLGVVAAFVLRGSAATNAAASASASASAPVAPEPPPPPAAPAKLGPGGSSDCSRKATTGCAALCTAGDPRACDWQGLARFESKDAAAKTEALTLFKKACEAGLGRGCAHLGQKSREPIGKPKVITPAVKTELAQWHVKACELEDGVGCGLAASDALTGYGVKRDLAKNKELTNKAPALLEKQCEASDEEACFALGTALEFGKGIARDTKRAKTVYQKACDGGDTQACARLKRPLK